MPRTRKPKPTNISEMILDQFGGPARPMSQGEVDAITKRLKKRRGRHEADLARPEQHHRRLVKSRELLASGDESIRNPVG